VLPRHGWKTYCVPVDPHQLVLPGLASVPEERYGTDVLGEWFGFPTTGPLAIMTRDHMHPPFVDSADIWATGARWYEGAIKHVEQAGDMLHLRPDDLVLDVGCGIGGPARTLVDRYDVEVIALTNVPAQLDAIAELNRPKAKWKRKITPVLHDANTPFPIESVDCVWSMNMLYWLENHHFFVSEARRVLSSGGKLLVDDWMFTDRAEAEAADIMRYHFQSGNLARTREFLQLLHSVGFEVLDIIDCGVVARTHLATHFRRTFDRDFRPRIEEFPEWGAELARDFAEAIEATIELYRNEQMTYWQIAACAA
jgi:cyclopropane fatty-acyl-phospholipid synthase-like methyltransferase